MTKLKCIVVDDEELARELIKTYIQKVDYIECVAIFESPLEALALLKSSKIDLLFLDNNMALN